jgi:hypothetical protein
LSPPRRMQRRLSWQHSWPGTCCDRCYPVAQQLQAL